MWRRRGRNGFEILVWLVWFGFIGRAVGPPDFVGMGDPGRWPGLVWGRAFGPWDRGGGLQWEPGDGGVSIGSLVFGLKYWMAASYESGRWPLEIFSDGGPRPVAWVGMGLGLWPKGCEHLGFIAVWKRVVGPWGRAKLAPKVWVYISVGQRCT